MKDETGGLLAHSHSILNRWKNYSLSEVRQIEDIRLNH
jgi:hypothetical protein